MRVKGSHIPVLQCHGPRRQARVKLSGIDIYLGDYGTPHAQAAYEQAIGAWLSNGRRWRPAAPGPATVEDLANRFLAFAADYYKKNGRETPSAAQARRAISLLYRAGLAQGRPEEFGPSMLTRFQRWLCAHPTGRFSRRTVNTYAGVVVQMFRWGAAEELLEAATWHALQAVRPLRKGRAPAAGIPAPREARRVKSVPEEVLAQTLSHAPPMLRAMMELQLATGMRPTELVGLRASNLSATLEPGVFAYHVPADFNKVDHRDIERTVYIGPRGMAVLRQWLASNPDGFVFSPRAARKTFDESRRAARKSPRWPSHSSEARAARRKAPARPPALPGDRYSTASYGRAISSACLKAFPHPTLASLREEELTHEQLADLKAWNKSHRWGPNRLRHNAASYITEHEKVEVAQLLLGHRHIETTMRYVQVDDRRAVSAALKHG